MIFESAITLSRTVLEGVGPGLPSESDPYALLNLMTIYYQVAKLEKSRELAHRLRQSTSNEQLRLIADGTALDDRGENNETAASMP